MGILAKLLFGGGADSSADIPALVKAGARIIDVRSPGEFSGGHIKGAINIPHNVIDRSIGQYETDKNKAIVVYCLSGARSGAAQKALTRMGYTQVINGGSYSRMRKLLGQ